MGSKDELETGEIEKKGRLIPPVLHFHTHTKIDAD